MKKILLILLTLSALYADAVDDILLKVKQNAQDHQKIDRMREKHFLQDIAKAKADIKRLEKAVAEEKSHTKQLQQHFKRNKTKLKETKALIDKKSESLKAFFADIRQESKNFSSLIQSSMTSAQYPKRLALLNKLQKADEAPELIDIRKFWELYLEEIIASGKVATFQTQVINENGKTVPREVTRVGLFTAYDANNYLSFDDKLKLFVTLQKQPNSNALDYISEPLDSHQLKHYLIDPTRGVLFSMLKERASVTDRIKQGGIIGYVILTLGAITALFALYKYIILFQTSRAVQKQLRTKKIDTRNPLGRILNVFKKHKKKDILTIESKLDTAILKELPTLQFGLSMIKLVAGVAPLLGLLGTVTGMIETFQSITLFGTGDPKLMAGGISQALMTTVLGLVVAIPLLFVYSILSAQAKKIMEIITQQSSALVSKQLDLSPQED